MAVHGECIIVLARDEGGKLRFCLEVRGRELRQYKGACNARPQGDDLALALKYVRAAKLKISTSDLPTSGLALLSEEEDEAGTTVNIDTPEGYPF